MRAISNDIVVMASARELSMGMTKLSGFQPLFCVNMATANEMMTINETAIMFVIKSCAKNFQNSLDAVNACMDEAVIA